MFNKAFSRLHSFVIDESGTPILIGNPLENKKI